jgi:hypothetical protein
MVAMLNSRQHDMETAENYLNSTAVDEHSADDVALFSVRAE